MEQPDRQFNELFQQLKQEDACRAPSFARAWASATSRDAARASHWPVWPVAVAALALLVCVGAWFAFFRRAPVEQIALPVTRPAQDIAPAPLRELPPVIAASTGKPVKLAKRQRRNPAPQLPLETLVSQWRSPTGFLLKTPGERWLNEVPRLGVPRLEIKPFVIEQQQNEMEEL